MMLKKFLFIMIVITSVCHGFSFTKSSNNEMVVKLSTEGVIIPVCLAGIDETASELGPGYGAQLGSVLRFDLDHNGRTAVINDSDEVRRLAQKVQFDRAIDPKPWRGLGVDYMLVGRMQRHKLELVVVATDGNFSRRIAGIPLTGDLNIDRRQIHVLSDKVHKLLFGQEGIANTRIIYTKRVENPKPVGQDKWLSDVWEMDYDGANTRQITHDGGYCVTPSWVPPPPNCASSQFFYVSYKSGQPKIYMGSLFGGKGERFSPLKGNQLMPTASKHLDKIAFISDVTGNPDLFLQDFSLEKGAIGKPRQIFSAYHATQGTPTFSPDSKKIAFVSNKDGSPRIYMMDIPAEGTPLSKIKAKLVSKRSRGSTAPNWSPDGSKISYCSKVDGVRQIWVYDLNKKQEKQITSGRCNKENPTWAPDSLHLVYNTNDPNIEELYMVDLNRLVPTKISDGSGLKRFPAWEQRGI